MSLQNNDEFCRKTIYNYLIKISGVIYLIEKLCNYLTKKIRKEMPEIDEERAEVINYGLQLVVGEIPKTLTIIVLAFILGIGKEALISFFSIIPYRAFSGGTHLKTHIGCFIMTTAFYIGNVYISKFIIIEPIYYKYILVLLIWIFAIVMIKLYAPADTVNVPILEEKVRKFKKIMSYIIMTGTLIAGMIVKNAIISNIIIYGTFLQTLMITRLMYKVTKNKYGYEEYIKKEAEEVVTNSV